MKNTKKCEEKGAYLITNVKGYDITYNNIIYRNFNSSTSSDNLHMSLLNVKYKTYRCPKL
jgi:hypothetical protein